MLAPLPGLWEPEGLVVGVVSGAFVALGAGLGSGAGPASVRPPSGAGPGSAGPRLCFGSGRSHWVALATCVWEPPGDAMLVTLDNLRSAGPLEPN